MRTLTLRGCSTRPLGSYLKALGLLRLISEQVDGDTRGWWEDDCFQLSSKLDEPGMVQFFLDEYKPTPILGPWNGGSGFYEKDRKVGINAIAASTAPRFADYRAGITLLRDLPEIKAGKAEKKEEEDRRSAILLAARNSLSDAAVEWLDAAVGLDSEGRRSFSPILGTGGNEGRLDYTNNFMERLAGLIVSPEKKTPVRELLENSLFGKPTSGLQPAAGGQYDPGRAGGFNQSQGIESPDVPLNPWDFVLTMEGAVAWASGLYRRQGISYRSVLCSPFTVAAKAAGFGSAGTKDEDVAVARAEIWTPIWHRPTRYAELKVLLREARASVDGRPARNGIEFAEAACSLGVDRGIDAFVRYNLLKRRGDSYIALPSGIFKTGYRKESDFIRKLRHVLDPLREPDEGLRRAVEVEMYEALLREGAGRLRSVMVAVGRLLRWYGKTGNLVHARAQLHAAEWLEACGQDQIEVRIAAALASIYDREVGSIRENLFASGDGPAWSGSDLPERMLSVLERRLRTAESKDALRNPVGGAYVLHPGDATLFIEGSVDDDLIEDLLFAFTLFDWKAYEGQRREPSAEVLPVYVVLKHLFLPHAVRWGGEPTTLRADVRVLSLIRAGRVEDATDIAVNRLRVAGFRPLDVKYGESGDSMRLAASLLIPTRLAIGVRRRVLHEPDPQ